MPSTRRRRSHCGVEDPGAGQDLVELLRPHGLIACPTAEESQRLKQPRRPSIIVSASGVMKWFLTADGAPDACYVVHGEPRASHVLRRRIHDELGWVAVVSRRGERVLLRRRVYPVRMSRRPYARAARSRTATVRPRRRATPCQSRPFANGCSANAQWNGE